MTPHTQPETVNTTSQVQVSTTDVQLAVLTEKVSQVIGNHEKRITDLEARGKNWPTVLASIAGVVTLIVLLAGKLSWS